MKAIYIIPFIIHLVTGNWQGCIQQQDLEAGKDGKVRINSNTAVCLSIAKDASDWADPTVYSRFSFAPVADDYSRFFIDGSYEQLIRDNNMNANITLFASSQTSVSFLRKFYDRDVGVFPYLTAIINVQDGVVRGISWDDACVFCGSNRCVENTYDFSGQQAFPREPTTGCYLTKQECSDIHSKGGNTCDLTLYVVWTGTDANGNYFTSSSKRFSAFSPKQIKDQVRDTIKGWNLNFDWL